MATEGHVAVVTEDKVIAIAGRNLIRIDRDNLLALVGCLVGVQTAEHDVATVRQGNRIVSAIVFGHGTGNGCTIAVAVGLVIGLVTLFLARRVVRTARVPSIITLVDIQRAGFVVAEAGHHIALFVVIKHLATVTEHQRTIATDIDNIVAKAAEYNQAVLCHVIAIGGHRIVASTGIDYELVVFATLVAINNNRIATFAAVQHGKGLEAVFAEDGLGNRRRIHVGTEVDFAVFHVTEGDVPIVFPTRFLVGILVRKMNGMCIRFNQSFLGRNISRIIFQGIANSNARELLHTAFGFVLVIHVVHKESIYALIFIDLCSFNNSCPFIQVRLGSFVRFCIRIRSTPHLAVSKHQRIRRKITKRACAVFK